jgi:hypothetical protein
VGEGEGEGSEEASRKAGSVALAALRRTFSRRLCALEGVNQRWPRARPRLFDDGRKGRRSRADHALATPPTLRRTRLIGRMRQVDRSRAQIVDWTLPSLVFASRRASHFRRGLSRHPRRDLRVTVEIDQRGSEPGRLAVGASRGLERYGRRKASEPTSKTRPRLAGRLCIATTTGRRPPDLLLPDGEPQGWTYSLAAERLARLGMDELGAGDCDAGKTMLLGRRLARGPQDDVGEGMQRGKSIRSKSASALPLIKKSERGREASQRATAKSVLIEAQRTEKPL